MTNKKKTLDTLVSDIYNKISVLSEGKHIDLDEDTIEQFGESMVGFCSDSDQDWSSEVENELIR